MVQDARVRQTHAFGDGGDRGALEPARSEQLDRGINDFTDGRLWRPARSALGREGISLWLVQLGVQSPERLAESNCVLAFLLSVD